MFINIRGMEGLKSIFKTLADSSRLKIIHVIGEEKKSVGEIVSETNLSQPLVSHHLRVLKEHTVLKTGRKGPFVYYSIRDIEILKAIDLFTNLFKDSFSKEDRKVNFCCENKK